jgi:hypothetical protein
MAFTAPDWLGESCGNLLAHEINASPQQVLHRQRAAAVGDMRHGGAHGDVQQHRADMQPRACAGGSELHLCVIGLRVSYEILELSAGKSLRAIRMRAESAKRETGAKSVTGL